MTIEAAGDLRPRQVELAADVGADKIHVGELGVAAHIQRSANLGAGVLLIAFIVFAFRQGMKVRPLDADEQPPVNRNVGPPPV